MERPEWMGLLSQAPAAALAEAFGALGEAPASEWLRPPEFGSVMVRGRMGGTGAPFNLGEMTVTRASLRLGDGTVGHAYVPGRDAEKARIAAVCDALLQGPAADRVREAVLRPMQALLSGRRADRAATRGGDQGRFLHRGAGRGLMETAAALRGGFADRPIEAAHAFRAALQAMARPGTVHRVGGARPPAPLSAAAGALALTLADGDTPLWLAAIARRRGRARLADLPYRRALRPARGGAASPSAAGTSCRSMRSPSARRSTRTARRRWSSRSTTSGQRAPPDRPRHRRRGVADRARPGVLAAPIARRFPLGVDLFLACGDRLAALPRTVRVG